MKKNEFNSFVVEYDSFLVCSHETPDADALGSSIALAIYLKILGKDAEYLLSDEIPINLEFLINKPLSVTKETLIKSKYQAIIVLDSSNLRRTPLNQENKIWNLPILNIDHHPDNDRFGDINILNFTASSTGEILYNLFDKYMIDKDIAKQLYAAIVGDTGGFKHSNTSAIIMRVAADLMEYEFNSYEIKSKILDFRTKNAFALVSDAISNVKIFEKFVIMTVNREIIKKYNLKPTEYPELVNYIRGIEGTYVAIVFTEVYDNNVKISFRSIPPVDISIVARTFGGGGHKYASGCQMNGEFSEIITKVCNFTQEYLEGLDLEID
ncbi:MAG: DHH family phosphoesterase [Clostridia bacterium]